MNWSCPHGISGKKKVDGKVCPHTHLRVCNQYRMAGFTGKKGCKKDLQFIASDFIRLWIFFIIISCNKWTIQLLDVTWFCWSFQLEFAVGDFGSGFLFGSLGFWKKVEVYGRRGKVCVKGKLYSTGIKYIESKYGDKAAVTLEPPDASYSSFSKLIEKLSLALTNLTPSDYDIFITGDFNLPQINWETLQVQSGVTVDSNLSAKCLLNFMSTYLLNQVVTLPTRGDNKLDLVLCNNERLVSDVTSESTEMSDHDMVNVVLSFNPGSMEKAQASYLDEMSFRSLDFNRADFQKIDNVLQNVDWKELRESSNFEEFPAEFTKKVLTVCLENVPRKRPPIGKPKLYNSLRRKKSRLKIRLSAAESANDQTGTKELEDEIGLVMYQIKEAHLDQGGKKAVDKIKVNPKYFYSYAKSFSKIKHSISALLNRDKKLVTDERELANLLH
ncbi:hypothetical protein ACHWQZ_G009922 [Mnemiopsis leidyi]